MSFTRSLRFVTEREARVAEMTALFRVGMVARSRVASRGSEDRNRPGFR
jgi:hypothetical protein